MPDKFFLSASGPEIADTQPAAGERVLWRGQCAVAEYAFDQPASLPRWTLPEETEVVVTDQRVLYRDPATMGTGELHWRWPQHLRVQPGNRETGRLATVTQIQLVCSGPAETFPALVFAGGDVTTVGDADRLANVLRQAIARYRVEHAGEVGLTAPEGRMLSRLVIGPEFSNYQGGDGQTVSLIGALQVQREAVTQPTVEVNLYAPRDQAPHQWSHSHPADRPAAGYAPPAPMSGAPVSRAAFSGGPSPSSAAPYPTPSSAAPYPTAPSSAAPYPTAPSHAGPSPSSAAPYPTPSSAAPYPTPSSAAPYPTPSSAAPYPTPPQAGPAPRSAAPYPTSPSAAPYPAPSAYPTPTSPAPFAAEPAGPVSGHPGQRHDRRPEPPRPWETQDDLDSRAAELAARVAMLVSGAADLNQPESRYDTETANLSAYLGRPTEEPPNGHHHGGEWDGRSRAEAVRRTATRIAGNAARERGTSQRWTDDEIGASTGGNHRR